jgi:hypothetical protein
VSPSPTAGEPSSPNAILGADGQPQQSPQPVTRVVNGDEFDWVDGLIGAIVALSLMLITLAAARTVARHRRATVESHA